jgi:hypothetical protein
MLISCPVSPVFYRNMVIFIGSVSDFSLIFRDLPDGCHGWSGTNQFHLVAHPISSTDLKPDDMREYSNLDVPHSNSLPYVIKHFCHSFSILLNKLYHLSWVRYPSRTTSPVTMGKSLYFDCFVLWMRRKTEIPCTRVSKPGQAKDPTQGVKV